MILHETSLELSQPIELYRFEGTHRSYHFTSDAVVHLYNGTNYMPVPGLKRGTAKIGTQDDDDEEFVVEIPVGQQIVSDYAFQTTPPALKLTLIRKDRSEAGGVIAWRGNVGNIGITGGTAKFKFPSTFSGILNCAVPNVAFQPMCNHSLYDARCGINRAANVHTSTITNIHADGRIITLASRGSFAENWFKFGEMVILSSGERRSIIGEDLSENLFRINYEFTRVSVGTPVEIAAGCDHGWDSPHGCSKWGNHDQYGAPPFMRGETFNTFRVGTGVPS